MFRRFRHCALAGVALLGLAFVVAADPGYLPVVGPAPLRFRVNAPPPTNMIKMALPAPEPPAETKPATNLPAAASLNASTNMSTNQMVAGGGTSSGTNNPGAAEPPPMNFDPRISSQMLLKFFTPSTNGPAAGVVAPLEFAPPSPPKPPSSTATYSN